MTDIITPEWYATHGRRSELDFWAVDSTVSVSILLVLITMAESRTYSAIDAAAATLWSRIVNQFPTWVGQRMTLGELWFVLPSTSTAVRDALAPLLVPHGEYDVDAAACVLPPDAKARLRDLDAVGSALQRHDAGSGPPIAWSIHNGIVAQSSGQ
jgi:hypothetical protein